MKELESHACFDGTLSIWEHQSTALHCPMRFSIFLPKAAQNAPVPCITFLSGLTCTHDNFTTKAGAYQHAAAHNIAIIAPDTSPRGEDVADDDAYDLGQGAGFYINATQTPWATHYHMEDYIATELYKLTTAHFPIIQGKQSIMGHSMGGHGALTLYFKYPTQYQSVSAFAPIVAPTQCEWGHKALSHYLGGNAEQWRKHDACELVKAAQPSNPMLIDQGQADNFLQTQLKPHLFEAACTQANQPLTLRLHPHYDHSYYFIQSFMADHVAHHAKLLAL